MATGRAEGGVIVSGGTSTSHQNPSVQGETSACLQTPPCGQKPPLHGNQGGEVVLKAPLKSLREEKRRLTEKTHFPFSALVR